MLTSPLDLPSACWIRWIARRRSFSASSWSCRSPARSAWPTRAGPGSAQCSSPRSAATWRGESARSGRARVATGRAASRRLPGEAHRRASDHRAGGRGAGGPPRGPGAAGVAARRAAGHAQRARPLATRLRGLQPGRHPLPPRHRAGVRQRRPEQIGAIVNTTLLVAFNAAIRVPGLARASLPRHQAILDAIRRRQPNLARAAMRRLVQNTGRSIGKCLVGGSHSPDKSRGGTGPPAGHRPSLGGADANTHSPNETARQPVRRG